MSCSCHRAYEYRVTIPLVTLLGLAERPGEISGLGPIDPGLARDPMSLL